MMIYSRTKAKSYSDDDPNSEREVDSDGSTATSCSSEVEKLGDSSVRGLGDSSDAAGGYSTKNSKTRKKNCYYSSKETVATADSCVAKGSDVADLKSYLKKNSKNYLMKNLKTKKKNCYLMTKTRKNSKPFPFLHDPKDLRFGMHINAPLLI
jgi:hypothetical protein